MFGTLSTVIQKQFLQIAISNLVLDEDLEDLETIRKKKKNWFLMFDYYLAKASYKLV